MDRISYHYASSDPSTGKRFIVALAAALLFFAACREGSQTAVPKLTKQLSSKDTAQRNQAALSLAGYGKQAEPAVPALIRLLSDPNAGVRSSAAFALRGIDTPIANDALEKATKK